MQEEMIQKMAFAMTAQKQLEMCNAAMNDGNYDKYMACVEELGINLAGKEDQEYKDDMLKISQHLAAVRAKTDPRKLATVMSGLWLEASKSKLRSLVKLMGRCGII